MDSKNLDNKPPTKEEEEEADALLRLMQSPKKSPFSADREESTPPDAEGNEDSDLNITLLVGAFAVGVGLVAVWYFYTSSGVVKDAAPPAPKP